jgi:hypothetical protein
LSALRLVSHDDAAKFGIASNNDRTMRNFTPNDWNHFKNH